MSPFWPDVELVDKEIEGTFTTTYSINVTSVGFGLVGTMTVGHSVFDQ